jgi:hypothetical protein
MPFVLLPAPKETNSIGVCRAGKRRPAGGCAACEPERIDRKVDLADPTTDHFSGGEEGRVKFVFGKRTGESDGLEGNRRKEVLLMDISGRGGGFGIF